MDSWVKMWLDALWGCEICCMSTVSQETCDVMCEDFNHLLRCWMWKDGFPHSPVGSGSLAAQQLIHVWAEPRGSQSCVRLGQASWKQPQRVRWNPVWCIIENAESGSAGPRVQKRSDRFEHNTKAVIPPFRCFPTFSNIPSPRLIAAKSPRGRRTAELSAFWWSLYPKKTQKWWLVSGSAFHPRLFTRIAITHFWWVQQYRLQNFSDVCALIRNVFVTMSDARFAKCADSAAAPMPRKSLLPYWVRFYCVNVGEDKEGLSPLFIFFPFPRSAPLSDDQARHQRRGGKNDTPFCCFHA